MVSPASSPPLPVFHHPTARVLPTGLVRRTQPSCLEFSVGSWQSGQKQELQSNPGLAQQGSSPQPAAHDFHSTLTVLRSFPLILPTSEQGCALTHPAMSLLNASLFSLAPLFHCIVNANSAYKKVHCLSVPPLPPLPS